MKHDQFNQGWRESNHMDRSHVVKEVLALLACYVGVVGMTVIVVHLLAK